MGVESREISGRLRVEQYRFGGDVDPLLRTPDYKRHINTRGRIRPQDHVGLMVGLKPRCFRCDLIGCRKEVVKLVRSYGTRYGVSNVICAHVAQVNFCSGDGAAAGICNDTSQGRRKRLGEGAWKAH